MREVALLLLLVNLGVLAWATWIQEDVEGPSGPGLPAALPGLVLTDTLVPATEPGADDEGREQTPVLADADRAAKSVSATSGGTDESVPGEAETDPTAPGGAGEAPVGSTAAASGNDEALPVDPADAQSGTGHDPGDGMAGDAGDDTVDVAAAQAGVGGANDAASEEAAGASGPPPAIPTAEVAAGVADPAAGETDASDAERPGDVMLAGAQVLGAGVEPASGGGDAAPFCVSLGPFLDLPETADAAAALRGAGYRPRQHLLESEVWIGHWVLLPPEPDRAQAIAVVEALRAEGVDDLYIEPGGVLRNSISLGLFSDRVRAETRAGNIRRLGYAPEIRDRTRTASVYWIDIEVRSEDEIDPADYRTNPNRNLRIEYDLCAEP